jgi:hypothetical protein
MGLSVRRRPSVSSGLAALIGQLTTGFFHAGCAVTLQRLYCLLVMEISSCYAHILGVTANPDGPWTRSRSGTS